MIALDVKRGMASDIGEVWVDDHEGSTSVVVIMMLTDENEVSFNWKDGKHDRTLYMPISRLRRLLTDSE